MTRRERDQLRERFDFRCGYCGVRETDVGALLTVDHFHPQSQNGADDASNWIYCCAACNTFKGAYWPQSGTQLALLNPLQDNSLHLEPQNGVLIALSPRGHNHIEQLHLNREPLVAHRRDVEERRQSVERLERALALVEHNRQLREQAEAELERWRAE